ncbi:envelope protein [Bat Hp-betacoronavirus/Zhejiang2013]|uniref:Envelope protein n=2 Tax=Orthocoronavirinae TaxID=2501931 RepID=A0A088DKU1_9BETC|nr:envelope protein [Bat Hp-betacoronavirus/Zhejiang2013]AIL94218.1 envelope protein [Bat Hp-betacoronavirus/Zhejiang2013]WCC63195.1 envelope protein [Bat Coronavirus HpHB20]
MYSFVSQETGTVIVNAVFILVGFVALLIVALAILTCLRLCAYCCNILDQGVVRPTRYVYLQAQTFYNKLQPVESELLVV